jgi:thiamine biosynthesis lipoprotein
MGTSWEVRLVAAPGADLVALRDGIEERLGTVVAQMSGWEAGSDLSRFNRAPAGHWQSLPAEFATVLGCALRIAAETGGAYDPTIGPLVDLWGFGPQPAPTEGPPGAAALAEARRRGGWERLRLNPEGRRVLQPGGIGLDLSGIAKGYAVDLVAAFLDAAGIVSFLVEIGGELRGRGIKPDGMPWWVALEAPPGGAAEEDGFRVALADLAVATSGDYRRYFLHGGRRYGHTLDPHTGWPLPEGIASVTVLHPCCMEADALATALAVLGLRAGMEHAIRRGIAALFHTREAGGRALREHLSPAFAALLV